MSIQTCQCLCCKKRTSQPFLGLFTDLNPTPPEIKVEVDDTEFFLKIIRDWKHSWMNQYQNDDADFENYFQRAFGIDANMVHSLAHRLEKAIKERGKR